MSRKNATTEHAKDAKGNADYSDGRRCSTPKRVIARPDPSGRSNLPIPVLFPCGTNATTKGATSEPQMPLMAADRIAGPPFLAQRHKSRVLRAAPIETVAERPSIVAQRFIAGTPASPPTEVLEGRPIPPQRRRGILPRS